MATPSDARAYIFTIAGMLFIAGVTLQFGWPAGLIAAGLYLFVALLRR